MHMASMEPRIVHTRLASLAIGVGLALCIIAAIWMLFPAQSIVRDGIEYGYVYSGTKSSSTSFAEANMDDRSLIVFGSSEFSTPRKIVPQVPSNVFGGTDYGLRLMLIGEAYDQSLWHAIALGAFEDAGMPRNKAVIIVTPGWFTDGGIDGETFKTRFSYSLYQAFCANARIPDSAKAYVRARLHDLGIEDSTLDAASPTLPQDYLNGLVLGGLDDLKLRQGLLEVRDKGMDFPPASIGDPEIPDFAALRAEAEAMGAEKTSSNDWGLEDSFYLEQLEPVFDELANSRSDETYSDTPEYDDLDCFLDIAEACGIDALVILAPEMGPYYDYIGISKETRKGCYDRVRDIVAQHDTVQIADYSDREYEKYFLYDIVHFGWTGWVDVEQSIYEFAQS